MTETITDSNRAVHAATDSTGAHQSVLSPAVADPQAADAELAAQPIGYWAGMTGRVVVGLLRDEMARLDVTQPMWWVLNRILAAGEQGATREAVAAQLAEVADDPYTVPRVLDQLLHRAWVSADTDGALHLTDAGRAGHAAVKRLVTGLRARVHEGVPDEEYVAALKVLRRMTANARAAAAASSAVPPVASVVPAAASSVPPASSSGLPAASSVLPAASSDSVPSAASSAETSAVLPSEVSAASRPEASAAS
ncbi:MarR family winged helix-turn-helix transcriptional regulator [Streptomyces sp. CC210A]|uniref:MarR family winged helix-turn-helix transcriptional regulator n=1 Tax=Streptomyces sp. CC210A TaxID=2898184 RepID=UPI0027E4AFCB|nr:MarR family winged helix-turn-helix transcriptional regulator [Streptomyces sp. CC210A]